ncbi:MAG: hypothetical protein EU542_02145 [Promethearchaeota archaeon]|nr:MAG: hypothetical protein EU542_02145 [Candidatus Lokiarchaeota archaeon]
MSDSHTISFFGQNTGIIIKSTSKFKSYIFIQCLKKNLKGKWEKPTANEGRTLRFTLEEMVMILQVLSRQALNWKSYHLYKEKKTSVSFSWEDEETKYLWINIADYSKVLNYAQVEIFRLLLIHLIEEKVVYSTTYIKNKFKDKTNEKQIENYGFEENKNLIYEEKNKLLKNISRIRAILTNETEKAILLQFEANKTYWIPKSSIHNQYLPRKNFHQYFLIDNWVLKKNKISLNLH